MRSSQKNDEVGGVPQKILEFRHELAAFLQAYGVSKKRLFYYIYGINVNLYTCKLLFSVSMPAEKEKEDEIQTIKPKERSETDKEKEKEEFETLEMESTGGGKEGGGG